MILLHVLMRESRPQFLDVLIAATAADERASVGNATFKDGKSTKTWSHSHFIQLYSTFLQEKIRIFSRTRLSLDHEPAQGKSRLAMVGPKLLFHQLPLFQDLLARLMDCWPQQLSVDNPVVMGAFQLLVKESFRLYKVINDGMINLIDKFFDLPVEEAGEALAVYERSLLQTDSLERFYEFAKGVMPGDSVQFPSSLKRVPSSFTETMRAHVAGGCVQEPEPASTSSNLLGSFRASEGPSSVRQSFGEEQTTAAAEPIQAGEQANVSPRTPSTTDSHQVAGAGTGLFEVGAVTGSPSPAAIGFRGTSASDDLLGGLDELALAPAQPQPIQKVDSTPDIIDLVPVEGAARQGSTTKVRTHTRLGSGDLENLYTSGATQNQQLALFGSPAPPQGGPQNPFPHGAQQEQGQFGNGGGVLLNQHGYPMVQQQQQQWQQGHMQPSPRGGAVYGGAEQHGLYPPVQRLSAARPEHAQTSPTKSSSPRGSPATSPRTRSKEIDPFADLR